MIRCIRTNSENEDFQKLVRELDADLSIRDGADHSFYAQFNKIDKIKYAVVAYDNEIPVGCGAIKEYLPETMEVKRMYVPPIRRGKGLATTILKELEQLDCRFKIQTMPVGNRQKTTGSYRTL